MLNPVHTSQYLQRLAYWTMPFSRSQTTRKQDAYRHAVGFSAPVTMSLTRWPLDMNLICKFWECSLPP